MQVGMAQDSESSTTNTLNHSLGVAAGFTTGYGLSYRFQPNKFGVQVVFGPSGSSNRQRFSSGLTFLYRLKEHKNLNLFVYQGNHYLYTHEEQYYYVDYDRGYTKYQTTHQFNNGAGFGFEFVFVDVVSLNFMVGYASYDLFNHINLTAETGLYYKF